MALFTITGNTSQSTFQPISTAINNNVNQFNIFSETNLQKAANTATTIAIGGTSNFINSIPAVLQYPTFPYFLTPLGQESLSYFDFRSRKPVGKPREDGKAIGSSYLVNTKAGPYDKFNIERTYGMGAPGDRYADRNDFTKRTDAATNWNSPTGQWVPRNETTPFRGDRVTVIDFGKREYNKIYTTLNSPNQLRKRNKTLGASVNGTNDFIKFYMTGPAIIPGSDTVDDVFVFRAALTNLYDSFNASWTPVQYIGRGDKNYQYGGFERTLNVDFRVYATDRDELKPIWRKLNYLASYTAPEYSANTLALVAPFMRITIGDLFIQQPVVLQSLTYSLHDSDSTWEINIEDDSEIMQVPHKIDVSCGFAVITDYLPQKGGNMYTLAKSFGSLNMPLPGNDNWLSDSMIQRMVQPIETSIPSTIQVSGNDINAISNNGQLVVNRGNVTAGGQLALR